MLELTGNARMYGVIFIASAIYNYPANVETDVTGDFFAVRGSR